MTKPSNEMLSDIANVYLHHDKLQRVLSNLSDVENDDFNDLSNQLVQFHQESSSNLRDILQNLPDIPVHNSMDESNTFGLPMEEYSLDDLETKTDSYILSAVLEAEVALRKYYQDTLMNHDLPDDYEETIDDQLEQLTDYLSSLERIQKISDE